MAKTKRSRREPRPSRLREARIRKGLTQAGLAKLARMHRNSIKNLESGRTREVTAPNAAALSDALATPVDELGLQVRSNAVAPSIRLRALSPDQRALLQEILSLPEEQYTAVRKALQRIRGSRNRRS